MIVAGETKVLEEGKCFVFDDSFRHEAFNDCTSDNGCPPRVILIVDFWHPDLTDEEVGIYVMFIFYLFFSGHTHFQIFIINFYHFNMFNHFLQVKFLEYINKAQVNSARQIHEFNKKSGCKETSATENDNDCGGSNFYETIQNVRQLAVDVSDELIWGNHLVIDD